VWVIQAQAVRDVIHDLLHLSWRQVVGVCLDLAPSHIDALPLIKPLVHNFEATAANLMPVPGISPCNRKQPQGSEMTLAAHHGAKRLVRTRDA
jgi:hypothetical protein